MKSRDQRVTCALKWHYLDNLDPAGIQERFEDHGVELTQSTIRDYLSEAPKEEIVEQIEQEHANTRLQIAEHEQRLFESAREAESEATRDEWVEAAEPKMQIVSGKEEPIEVSNWERLEPGDDRRPAWATDRDTVVMFVEGSRELYAGAEYPAGARRAGAPARAGTFPEFTTRRVGLERDVPDQQAAAMARQEQSQHLKMKGEVLGVYSMDINLDADVDATVDQTQSLDEDTLAQLDEITDGPSTDPGGSTDE